MEERTKHSSSSPNITPVWPWASHTSHQVHMSSGYEADNASSSTSQLLTSDTFLEALISLMCILIFTS